MAIVTVVDRLNEEENVFDLEKHGKIVRELLAEKFSPIKGDIWYVISNDWWKVWESYVENLSGGQSSTASEPESPGPIDNSSIIDENKNLSKVILRPNLIESLDYVLLPGEAWNEIKKRYGLKDNKQEIPRDVIETGLFHKTVRVEVYPLELNICCVDNENDEMTIVLSRASTLENLRKIVKGKLKIDERVRLYLENKLDDNTNDVKYEYLDFVKHGKTSALEYLLSPGTLVIVDVLNAEGKGKFDLTKLSGRTSRSSSSTKAVMPSTFGTCTSAPDNGSTVRLSVIIKMESDSEQVDPSPPFADGCCLFDRLPAELLNAVICQIDDIPCKMRLDLVSKRFYKANHKPQSWIFDKALAINYGHLPIEEQPPADGLDANEGVKWKLKLTFLPANRKYGIEKPFYYCGFPSVLFDAEKGLRSLDVFLKRTQTETLHLEGFDTFPNEQVWVFKELADTFVKNRPSLVQLNSLLLSENRTKPVTWLLSAFRGCNLPQLKKLGICSDSENVDDLIWPFIDSCHHLTSLTLWSHHITDVHSCISALSNKSQLLNLCINVLGGDGSLGVDCLLEVFKGCPELSRFKFLSQFMNPTELSERLPVTSREKIRKFSCFCCPHHDALFTRQVAYYYPNIEKVSFFIRGGFDPDTVTRAIAHLIDACQGEKPRTIDLYMPLSDERQPEEFQEVSVNLLARRIWPPRWLDPKNECKKNNVTIKWDRD